jgi:hypothetical protein
MSMAGITFWDRWHPWNDVKRTSKTIQESVDLSI